MADYTITELADLSGVNRRNIHFYVQQGLLPPPEGAGLGARYNDEHLLRLRAIPILRNRGLRLDEIRERLVSMRAGEIEDLLMQPAPEPAERAPLHFQRPWQRAETVMRYTLAPGVELLVGPGAERAWHTDIAELTQAIQRILRQRTDSNLNGGQS
jgi:DNA-binding transcriptional MerR regulator